VTELPIVTVGVTVDDPKFALFPKSTTASGTNVPELRTECLIVKPLAAVIEGLPTELWTAKARAIQALPLIVSDVDADVPEPVD
jgi:hypothetical protein